MASQMFTFDNNLPAWFSHFPSETHKSMYFTTYFATPFEKIEEPNPITPEEMIKSKSLTARYLKDKMEIDAKLS